MEAVKVKFGAYGAVVAVKFGALWAIIVDDEAHVMTRIAVQMWADWAWLDVVWVGA